MTSLFSLPKLISQRARCTFCLLAAIMSLSITRERRCSPKKSNKPQRRERVVAERFSAFYLFAVSIHTSRHHRNCCQQVPRSIRHPTLGYRQNTLYFLMAQIDLDASEFSFEQVKEHSKEIQSAILPPPPLLPFLCKGAARRFNSQENQLKAGTGLTYTQWSKIDQRHPA